MDNMKKVALVVGGSGGIGSAIVDSFLGDGMSVYATYYRQRDDARAMRAQESCSFIPCDLRKESDIASALDRILEKESRLDVIVNAATPPLKLKLFDQLSWQEFMEDIDVLLLGAVTLIRQAVPHMKRQRSGTIVNILTETIGKPASRLSSYITAKAGVLGLTRALGVELKPYNISLYGVSPSFVETELLEAFPAKLLEFERQRLPDKRFLTPGDIAELVADILRRPDRYRSGAEIPIRSRHDILTLVEA